MVSFASVAPMSPNHACGYMKSLCWKRKNNPSAHISLCNWSFPYICSKSFRCFSTMDIPCEWQLLALCFLWWIYIPCSILLLCVHTDRSTWLQEANFPSVCCTSHRTSHLLCRSQPVTRKCLWDAAHLPTISKKLQRTDEPCETPYRTVAFPEVVLATNQETSISDGLPVTDNRTCWGRISAAIARLVYTATSNTSTWMACIAFVEIDGANCFMCRALPCSEHKHYGNQNLFYSPFTSPLHAIAIKKSISPQEHRNLYMPQHENN